jgi:hypothetical protein
MAILKRLAYGMKLPEIAKDLDGKASYWAIYRYSKNPEVKRLLKIDQEEILMTIRLRLLDESDLAISRLVDRMNDPKTPVSLQTKIALGLIDRAGFKPDKETIILNHTRR